MRIDRQEVPGHDVSGPMAKVRIWLRFAFTPTLRQIERVSLPSWLFPLYYLMRAVRVLRTTIMGARLMAWRRLGARS
jgi:hypothetical protein